MSFFLCSLRYLLISTGNMIFFTILKKKEGGAGTPADIHMCEKAAVTGDVYKDDDPEKDDTVYFLLQDSTHQFTIGLSDILACLKFAEEEGEVPKLPGDWWSTLSMIYPKLEIPVEVPDDADETF